MEKDFFDKNFDFTKYPKDLKLEEWKEKRKLLSNFFTKFTSYYKEYLLEKNLNPNFYCMSRPFHMLFGINDEKLFFVVSNESAFRSRTYLYKLNDGVYMDTRVMSSFTLQVGLHGNRKNPLIISDFNIEVINECNDEIIKEEAIKMVEFEINEMEMNQTIMRVKPYFGDIKFRINKKKIFMLMPFGYDEINEFYEDHIKIPLKEMDFNCMRADDIFSNNSIIDDIWRNINEARIIIADLTHRNPNVFYEVGIAHTLGKEVILLSQEKDDIPFDLRHIRTIFYKNTPRGAEQFTMQLVNTVNSILCGNIINETITDMTNEIG